LNQVTPSWTASIRTSYVPGVAGIWIARFTVALCPVPSACGSGVRAPSHTNTAPLALMRWYEMVTATGCHTRLPTFVTVTGTVMREPAGPATTGELGA